MTTTTPVLPIRVCTTLTGAEHYHGTEREALACAAEREALEARLDAAFSQDAR